MITVQIDRKVLQQTLDWFDDYARRVSPFFDPLEVTALAEKLRTAMASPPQKSEPMSEERLVAQLNGTARPPTHPASEPRLTDKRIADILHSVDECDSGVGFAIRFARAIEATVRTLKSEELIALAIEAAALSKQEPLP